MSAAYLLLNLTRAWTVDSVEARILRGGPMPIEIVDMVKKAGEGKRQVIFNTKKFHAWVHVYPKPGDADDMHCHNADQTFYVIDGECTMHFPDGGKAVM